MKCFNDLKGKAQGILFQVHQCPGWGRALNPGCSHRTGCANNSAFSVRNAGALSEGEMSHLEVPRNKIILEIISVAKAGVLLQCQPSTAHWVPPGGGMGWGTLEHLRKITNYQSGNWGSIPPQEQAFYGNNHPKGMQRLLPLEKPP